MPGRPAGPLAAYRLPSGPWNGSSSGRRAGTSISTSWRATSTSVGRGTGVPPHGAGDDGGGAARGTGCGARRGARSVLAAPRRVRPALQDGLVELGLELLVAAEHRLPQLTTVRIPARRRRGRGPPPLLSTYGIEIGAGAGQLAGQVWRIGCMGHTARRATSWRCWARWGRCSDDECSQGGRHAPLELRGRRVLLRSLTEDDFAAWHEVRTRCADWLLRWEPRPKGAPVPSEDRPSFAARCGIRERERHLAPATASASSSASVSPAR